MSRQMHECLHCGNLFEPKASNRTTYCSREHAFADGLRVGSGARVPKGMVRQECSICWSAFYGIRGFCCNACRRIAYVRGMEHRPHRKGLSPYHKDVHLP